MYYILDDNRIWGTAQVAFIPVTDPAYVAWLTQDSGRMDADEQPIKNAPVYPAGPGRATVEELRTTLLFYGLPVGQLANAEDRMVQIDKETSQAILAGFGYQIQGKEYHFSYDTFDQQNFADTANACLLLMQGVEGLPQTVTWNAYKDDQLVRLTLTAQEFLQLYTAGALAHKALQMEMGGQKKAAL